MTPDERAALVALVEHNDLLRSAFQAAQRDAILETEGSSNYRLMADAFSQCLRKHHETVNRAREAMGLDKP